MAGAPCHVLGAIAVLSGALLVQGQIRRTDEIKPRELYEIAQENVKVGLDPFFEGNMEPWGVVAIAYVKRYSANHRLMKKMSGITNDTDKELFDLQMATAAALDWHEEESLELVKRDFARVLWKDLDTPPLDPEPIVFSSKPGEKWKYKDVKEFFLENAFPTINYRVHGYQDRKGLFPFEKYFGHGVRHSGVGLVFGDLGNQLEFKPQFQAARALKPYFDELVSKKIHVAVIEKSKGTKKMRQALKMGLDPAVPLEFYLIENARMKKDNVDNYENGNPTKYRLTDWSEAGVAKFFGEWRNKTLPTFWGSLEEDRKNAKRPEGQLAAWNFEEEIYDWPDKSQGILVAFHMSDPIHGCIECERDMKVWAEVMKEVRGTQTLKKRFIIATMDQSLNEHGERLVPGKLAQPLVVWYPPGTPEKRRKTKKVRTIPVFAKDAIMEQIRDLLEEVEEVEREGTEEL